MKKQVKKFRKSKVFNSVNIILVALILVEVVFVINEGVFTGNPVKGTASESADVTTCIPSTEICDSKDNDCDSQIDEGGVCDTTPPLSRRVAFYRQNPLEQDRAAFMFSELGEIVPEVFGYIVEFKDPPAVAKFVELRKQSDTKLTESQKSVLSQYRKQLEEKHKSAKSDFEKILNKELSAKVLSEFTTVFNGIALDITEKEAKMLEKSSYVKKVHPNYRVYTTLMDSVPLINADDVWQLQDSQGRQITGEGVTIGIIDTGIDYTHPDLGGCIGLGCKVVGGYDFSDNDNDPMDCCGHGTHVAATAGGNGFLKGVAPDALIYSLKVFPNAYDATIINAINYSVDPNGDGDFSDHLDIISMSLGKRGPGDPDDPMSQAVDNAVNLGVVAVVSAGNSGPSGNSYCRSKEDLTGASYSICSPGVARKAITVAASNKSDVIAGFSSRGPVKLADGSLFPKPDISAPGVNICAAQWDSAWNDRKCFDDNHVAISGTSMAAPHVSGAVALLKQAHPDATPEDIKLMLQENVVNIGEDVYTQGAGRIDIFNAVNLSKNINLSAHLNYLGRVSGVVEILGTANGSDFSSYTLEFGNGINPRIWTVLINSNTPINGGVFYLLDTVPFEDGYYSLRLIVEDGKGNNISYSIKFSTDNYGTVINFPQDGNIEGRLIEIIGDAYGPDFISYDLDYSSLIAPDIWLDDGLELTNEGTLPVINGRLALLNTSSFPQPGLYNLRLIAEYTSSRYEHNISLYIDKTLKEGWPKRFEKYQTWWGGTMAPVIDDINADGYDEIIFFFSPNKLHVLQYNGTPLHGFPIQFSSFMDDTIPVVGDIDKDDFKEIFFQETSDSSDGSKVLTIYAYHYNGSNVSGWPVYIDYDIGSQHNSPVIADLDLDGYPEIIVRAWINTYIFSKDGKLLQQIDTNDNHFLIDGYELTPSVGNLDDDPELEVVTGGCWDNPNQGIGMTTVKMHVLNIDGSDVDGWPLDFFGCMFSSPAIGDVDNDGDNEVVIIAPYGIRYPEDPDQPFIESGGVYILYKNGTIFPGWPQLRYIISSDFTLSSPVLADLDNDGDLEIIAEIRNNTYEDEVYVFEHTGTIKSGWPPEIRNHFSMSPIISDLDKDGKADILSRGIFGSSNNFGYSEIYAWKSNGSMINNFPKLLKFGITSPQVADIDGNGKLEVIATSTSSVDLFGRAVSDEYGVYVWELDNSSEEKLEWPQFHHDAQHTGLYTSPYTCADLNHDGIRDVIDVVELVDYAFRGEPEPQPKWIGDMNGDNVIDVIDVVKIVDYVFRGGSEPTCTSQQNQVQALTTLTLQKSGANILVSAILDRDVAGMQFDLTYDSNKIKISGAKTTARTTGMIITNTQISNGKNRIGIYSGDGSKYIKAGSGSLFTIQVSGTDLSSLKVSPIVVDYKTKNKFSSVSINNKLVSQKIIPKSSTTKTPSLS